MYGLLTFGAVVVSTIQWRPGPSAQPALGKHDFRQPDANFTDDQM